MSTLRRPGRRGGAPEHRLDVLTLARRIGLLGTGLTVATSLALCAVIENALVPELTGGRATPGPSPSGRHGNGSGKARPSKPTGTLTKAVDKAVTERLAATARATYGKDAAKPVVRYTRRDRRRGWAFGTSVMPAPGGSAAIPEAALFLAHRSGKKWSIGVGGTDRFRRFLERAPSSVLPSAERWALTKYAIGHFPAAPAGGGGSETGLGLPWRKGRAWTLASAGAGTLTFDHGDGVVRAAAGGRLYRMCGHGLVMIVHDNGLATEYAQVTDLPSIPDGGHVSRGAYLGHVGAAAPCRKGRTTARLRFALRSADTRLPVDGLRLGVWTLHTRSGNVWATCPGQRVDTGEPMPNESAPPSASPAPTGSAVPTPSRSPGRSPHPSPSRPTSSPEVLQ